MFQSNINTYTACKDYDNNTAKGQNSEFLIGGLCNYKIRQAVPDKALVFGICVPMPIMVKVEEVNPAPNSKCDIRVEWFK